MKSVSVLLVDDEVPFVAAMIKRLEKRGYGVKAAHDGLTALDLLDQNDGIEVVILDVKMPVMDGVETLRRIKQAHPLVEVVMLTGHATVETAIDGMRLGAHDYLMKPCEMDVLTTKVNQAAAKKRAHDEKIMAARIKEIVGRRD